MTVSPRRTVHRRRRPGAGATVLALVPAHDEESSIAQTIESLRRQGRAIAITVVADNCTDDTVAVARRLGCDVIESVDDTDAKAGALNQALKQILPGCGPDGYVLVTDADTVLGADFVSRGCATRA